MAQVIDQALRRVLSAITRDRVKPPEFSKTRRGRSRSQRPTRRARQSRRHASEPVNDRLEEAARAAASEHLWVELSAASRPPKRALARDFSCSFIWRAPRAIPYDCNRTCF